MPDGVILRQKIKLGKNDSKLEKILGFFRKRTFISEIGEYLREREDFTGFAAAARGLTKIFSFC